jgi:hypothetical protein
VAPDGAYAIARDEGTGLLRLVDLEDGTIRTLDVASLSFGGDLAVAPPPSPLEPAPSSSGIDGGAEGDSGALDAGSEGGGETVDPIEADAGSDAEAQPLPPSGDGISLGDGIVTDLDLAPSGEFALAVVRSTGVVLRLPIPAAFEDSSTIEASRVEGELVGSATFTPDGARALLFTTADPRVERVTVLELATGSFRSIQLRKSVRTLTVVPDGDRALIVHQKLPGSPTEEGIDLDEQIDRSYGYSLVDIDSGFAKLELTPVEVGPIAIVPDGSHLFLLYAAPSPREVQRANLQNFAVDRFALGSPPVSVGAVPGAGQVFVGQEHVDGRIAFIDWLSGDVRSVSGFELNSRIRE